MKPSSHSNTDIDPDKQETSLSTCHIIPRQKHNISRKNISRACLNVLYGLNENGFDAYIVGGAVRDLLLGKNPKDFDIATDAHPEEVRKIFRNARIIGRRFRIVHVQFGRSIIEVSTFRAGSQDSMVIKTEKLSRNVTHIDAAQSQSGMLLRDNVYGTIEEDALRRDFTVNALYYTVRNFEVHDFLNGMKDIESRTLRMIGDPEQRYREDPVRMLRAVRLSAKLGFSIDSKTAQPIARMVGLLDAIPAARLFDEIIKAFFNGHAVKTYTGYKKHGLFDHLFPATANLVKKQANNEKINIVAETCLQQAFAGTDERLSENKSVNPAFLLAAILWPPVQAQFEHYRQQGLPPMVAMHEAGQDVIRDQVQIMAIPKRFTIPMREIWEYQLRLARKNRAENMVGRKRFRAAYDFVLLREKAGEDLQGLGQWWTQYQEADSRERENMRQMTNRSKQHSKKSKHRVKSSANRNRSIRKTNPVSE